MRARIAGLCSMLLCQLPSLLSANPSPCRVAPGYLPVAGVELHEDAHTVVVTQGPFSPPPVEAGAAMPMMDGMQMPGMADTIVQRLNWPVSGWLRGFHLDVCDAQGHAFPEEVVHHLVLIDLGRRQLWRPVAERVLGIGEETADASLPESIGVPVKRGEPMAIHIMWHNLTGRPIRAWYRLTLLYTPANQAPRPVDVLPVVFEVSPAIGMLPSYNIPAGRSERAFPFTVPVGGRVLAVGGHMHDYGRSMAIEDVSTGRVLFRVSSAQSADGRVVGIHRKLLAIRGRGVRLKANHPYRITATYDNPTADSISGVMAQLATIFAPDRERDWPAVDTTNALYRADIKSLRGASVPVEAAGIPVAVIGGAAARADP